MLLFVKAVEWLPHYPALMRHEVEYHLTVKTYTHNIIKYNNITDIVVLTFTIQLKSIHYTLAIWVYITCFRWVTNAIFSILFINYYALRHKQILRVISTIILSIFVWWQIFFSLIKHKLLSKRSPSWQKSAFCYGNKQLDS